MSSKPTQEYVYQHITRILHEQFDLDPSSMTRETDLRADLDIDSIDAVNILIELKSLTSKKVAIENFHQIKTVGDLVDVVYGLLNSEGAE
ncbi:MAG: acyl carrier protein [Cellvibrionaceae bacterium]|nr:acyl carrier protein [Cellvibrionaceae bacterium]